MQNHNNLNKALFYYCKLCAREKLKSLVGSLKSEVFIDY
jgi:hypothetical protein